MEKLILEILEHDSKYWYEMILFYDKAAKRGILERKNEFEVKNLIAYAAFLEVDAIKETILNEENEFSYIPFFTSPRKNDPNKLMYYTRMYLYVKNEENLGKQLKLIPIWFSPDIDLSKVKEGTLVVKKDKMKKPSYYEIKEENGIKKTPYIYIQELFDVIKFEYLKGDELK